MFLTEGEAIGYQNLYYGFAREGYLGEPDDNLSDWLDKEGETKISPSFNENKLFLGYIDPYRSVELPSGYGIAARLANSSIIEKYIKATSPDEKLNKYVFAQYKLHGHLFYKDSYVYADHKTTLKIKDMRIPIYCWTIQNYFKLMQILDKGQNTLDDAHQLLLEELEMDRITKRYQEWDEYSKENYIKTMIQILMDFHQKHNWDEFYFVRESFDEMFVKEF